MNRRSLNLIPPATRRRLALRRLTRTWSTAIVLCSVAAGSLLALEWTRGMFAARELRRLEARFAPLVKVMEENRGLKKQITELRAREQLSLRLSRKEHGIAAIAAVTAATRGGAGEVYLSRLNYEGPTADAAAKARPDRFVDLSGAGIDGSAVAAMVQRLRADAVFRSVAVQSTDPMPGGDARLRQFEVRCQL